MKRANLQRIALFTVFAVVVPVIVYAQPYIIQNFTLSDFGDGNDAARSLVWKPVFSEFAVQAEKENQEEGNAEEVDQVQEGVEIVKNNPDPERNAVRYSEAKPDGVTDVVAGPQKYVLGVKAAFTKQGYNWIELFPHRIGEEIDTDKLIEEADVTQADPIQAQEEDTTAPDINAESVKIRIPFRGIASEISMWAWGGRYGWLVESHIRDYLNYSYVLPMGDLMYRGWRQKRVDIPSSIVQTRIRIPAIQSLVFEKIKLWSYPSERVDQFYVYFDLLQHGAHVSLDKFDGQELGNDLW